tara:strand:+ start:558 stop:674 length:117 start_codon:yes stop_codon:yes gene_type:complete
MNKKDLQKLVDYVINKKRKREAKEKKWLTFMDSYFEMS